MAKMTAVRERVRCGILFDVPNNIYRVVRISPGPDNIYGNSDDPTPVTLKTVLFSEYGSGVAYGHGSAGTAIVSGFDNNVTFPGDGIMFDSRGMVLSPTGAASTDEYYVYLQNNRNNTYAAGVWSAGVIVMRRWTGSAWQQ
jgi:hypothetical protein